MFLPTAPQHHNSFYQSNYLKICKKISKNYNLLIKGHPTDYAKRKLQKEYNGKRSWEKLLPEIRACNPEDFYSAIIHSTAAIAIYTTAFFEINNFVKPIIFVNRFEQYAYNILGNKINIPDKIYDKNLYRKKYDFNDEFLEIIKNNLNYDIQKNEFFNSSGELTSKLFDFYGCDIKLKNLSDFLDNFKDNNSINEKEIFESHKNIPFKILSVLNEYLRNNENKKLINRIQNKVKILIFKLLRWYN